MWSPCARSHAPPPQRSWQRSQAQSTNAGGKRRRKEEDKGAREKEGRGKDDEEEDIKRERCSGEEVTRWKRQTLTGKGGGESNEKKRKEWTKIREER